MSDKRISELQQADFAQAGDLIPFARGKQTLTIELSTFIALAKGAKGNDGSDGKNWAPDGYGSLTDALIASVESAGVPYIYLVNPNSDSRADQGEPPPLAGDQGGSAIGWSPTNGWVSYGPIAGLEGPPGQGVPAGGNPGQILEKLSATDYETRWANRPQPVWGGVGGNLEDQEDLRNALDAKVGKTANRFTGVQTFGASVVENRVQVSGTTLDLSRGNYFTLAASGSITLSLSNAPSDGIVAFVLDITSSGSVTVNLWGGIVWAGGAVPSLTENGRDVFGFILAPGGNSGVGVVMAKDVK